MEGYQKRGYLLEDFRLFHLYDAPNSHVDYHYHEFCKLLLLVSGSGYYAIEGKRYLLHPGDFVLLDSRCVHRPEFENDSPYERIILYVSPEFLQRESSSDCNLRACFSEQRGCVFRPGEQNASPLFSLIKSMELQLSSTGQGRSILARGTLLQLLVELACQLGRDNAFLPTPTLPSGGRMLDILHYLDKHITEPISIDDLAERFYISKYHMMRQFRKETGNSIHGYLSTRRLTYARDLIAAGTSATDACFTSGFRSYSSFTRAYGKLFGTTPTGRTENSVGLEEDFE